VGKLNSKGNIVEIFSSLQGEGPHTGEAMTFLRFAGCSFGCRWCDTTRATSVSPTYRIETPPTSGRFIDNANPVTPEELAKQLTFFADPTISVTGGEPLEQADFILSWLKNHHPQKKILLETNGVFSTELEKLSGLIDIVSMDMKLPSSTGRREYWSEHAKFLSTAIRTSKETYVKIVVTPDTTTVDVQQAIKIISSINKFVQVVLQPVASHEGCVLKTTDEKVSSVARLCKAWLPNVSIMPQMHKLNGWL